ncbi:MULTISPECIES: potassium-transporting ATPase subunit C [Mycolicibacter]|uniref:Potassium-transporting ATPase KdpC subunit n=1 Tax=Mycolicibacter virginiensis TaxID=1795032 RepID=A0A9X7NWT5_9MYCO|nr:MULTISPECIES: potassium-transporting ATPase subunit C [Mycolicibacter]OBJ34347.1 K+-transporting ATPase subunit C [Mycolicibacter heraklionensis]PQM50229.1 potassium-transporting ATPase subunit C [Mycolicibacter virginiensis]ULP48591.1 potassium-transporting ATPase subunit C [Mycolicibacter virginiensis]
MRSAGLIRGHWAALRALLVFTVVLGVGYPVLVWLVAQIPGLHGRAEGSLITDAAGRPVASALIGQSFTDAAGRPLPQYFQGRPSGAGIGYDALASGASNLGPESIVDMPDRPSLLTQVCARSVEVAQTEGLAVGAGGRPFCTAGGRGAVLAVFGPRGPNGTVARPTRVVSVNEPCAPGSAQFVSGYRGVRVECARPGEDYSAGQIVPIRGAAAEHPRVPADAVTASGSGLDPDISPAYAELQVDRVAKARGIPAEQVRAVLRAHRSGRLLGFLGETRVNVVAVNLELDHEHPVPGCCFDG